VHNSPIKGGMLSLRQNAIGKLLQGVLDLPSARRIELTNNADPLKSSPSGLCAGRRRARLDVP
jgi:hypothetical protein